MISIVTPSYNQKEFIEESICSVLQQDYDPVEYFVFDGGSDDGTLEVIEEYADQIDYWKSRPDGGQVEAINKGWRRSRGELLGWVNSDDLLLPGALRTVAEAAEENPNSVLFFGKCLVVDRDGRAQRTFDPSGFTKKDLLAGKSLAQPSVFIRRQVLDEIGYLDDSLNYALDWSFFLKVFWKYGDEKTTYIPRTISGSREYEGTKTRTGLSDKADERRRKIQQFVDGGVLPESQDVLSCALSGTYWIQGADEFLAGQYSKAIYSGIKAIRYNPASLMEKMKRMTWLIQERMKRAVHTVY